MRKLSLIAAVSLVALLAIGATAANAHRGPGRGAKGGSASALVTQAAKQLDEADELKEEAEDNLRYAMGISRTKTVASKLGITTAKLNAGFRAARKALIVARIDKAVADGDLTDEEAAERKAELDEEDLPGYKAGGGFGFGGFGSPGERGGGPRGK